jgi:hypothetical protein
VTLLLLLSPRCVFVRLRLKVPSPSHVPVPPVPGHASTLVVAPLMPSSLGGPRGLTGMIVVAGSHTPTKDCLSMGSPVCSPSGCPPCLLASRGFPSRAPLEISPVPHLPSDASHRPKRPTLPSHRPDSSMVADLRRQLDRADSVADGEARVQRRELCRRGAGGWGEGQGRMRAGCSLM